MGANVECNGHCRDFYSLRDLFWGTEGNRWNICHDNSRLRSSNQHDHSLSSLSPDHLLGHNKEALKQTMLKHEAILRGQIEELHHLYWKQKTLMEELTQNGTCQQIVREGPLQSSSFFYPVPYENAQKPCHPPEFPWSKAGSQSLASQTLNTQPTSDFVQACGDPASTKVFQEDFKLLEHKYKKVGKKMLDLHLPACEYIDSDEEEYLVYRKTSKASSMPFSNEKPYPGNNILNSSLCKHVFGPGTSLRSSAALADLNESIDLDEDELAPQSNDLLNSKNLENGTWDASSRTEFGSHISSNNLIPNTMVGQEIEAWATNPSVENKDSKGKCLPSTNEAGTVENSFLLSLSTSKEHHLEPWYGKMINGVDINTSRTQNIATLVSAPRQTAAQADLISSCPSPFNRISEASGGALGRYSRMPEHVTTSKDLDLNVIPDGCLPQTLAFHGSKTALGVKFDDLTSTLPWFKETPIAKGQLIEGMFLSHSETKEIKDSKEEGVHNLSISVIPACSSGKDIPSDEHFLGSDVNNKHKDIGLAIDLNSYSSEGDNALQDTDLQAPVSPENKESSPPRGESDGNQPESSYQLLEQEDTGLEEKELTMAAKVLVSISTCWVKKCLQTSTSRPACKYPSSDSLYWFAGIIDRVEDDPDDCSKVVLSDKTGDYEEFPPNEIDEFEAMTLELRETVVEDCLCVTNDLKDEEAALTSSPFQARKSRSRRGRQRKDFQREILPSLASLSRYEVTEDLQLIGGLIEAAIPRMEKNCLRSSSRTGFSRGRKRSAYGIMNHNALGSMTDQSASSNNELSMEKRCLIGWGNITRKRRGQRYSAKPS